MGCTGPHERSLRESGIGARLVLSGDFFALSPSQAQFFRNFALSISTDLCLSLLSLLLSLASSLRSSALPTCLRALCGALFLRSSLELSAELYLSICLELSAELVVVV